MHLSKRAQSVLEFCLIITLVILNVLLMGPYFIRAVNAHLKGWEDSVADSANDPLNPAGVGSGGFGCSCDPVNMGCGLRACAASEMLVMTLCNPVGCPGAEGEVCVLDPVNCPIIITP